jgi:hypothetical protein
VEKLGLTLRQNDGLALLKYPIVARLDECKREVLAKHLAKTVITAMKDRAKTLERHAVPVGPGDMELSEADFSKQIVATLRNMGLRKLADLARLSKSDLWAQSQLGGADVKRILRVYRDHGVTLMTVDSASLCHRNGACGDRNPATYLDLDRGRRLHWAARLLVQIPAKRLVSFLAPNLRETELYRPRPELGHIGFRREMLLQVAPEEAQDVLPRVMNVRECR